MGWDLDRFIEAQDQGSPWGDRYEAAIQQLRQGRKTGHWMWYVFPQVEGLGSTEASRRFAIGSLDEARAFLAHPILGARLLESARALLAVEGPTSEEILDPVDTRKLRSSMTLFKRAAPYEPLFGQVLDRFFDGRVDERTDELLRDHAAATPIQTPAEASIRLTEAGTPFLESRCHRARSGLILVGEARWQAGTLGEREVARLDSMARLAPHPTAEPILMLWGRRGVDPAVTSRRVRGFDLPQMLGRAAG